LAQQNKEILNLLHFFVYFISQNYIREIYFSTSAKNKKTIKIKRYKQSIKGNEKKKKKKKKKKEKKKKKKRKYKERMN